MTAQTTKRAAAFLLLVAFIIGSLATLTAAPTAQAAVAPTAPAVASTAPLLPGETLWSGVPSDLFGLGDTYDYIGATGFDHSATIQSQVKAAHVPLIRAFFESVDETDHTTPITDAQQLVIAQAIANSGAQCMANITQPVTVTQALHLVSILAPYCRYFEVYNEPDLSGQWPPAVTSAAYLAFWNAFVPQARAEDPSALFGGPALATEFGLDDPNYLQNVLSGMEQSGVAPDFITYHWYICSGVAQSSCLADTAQWTPTHGATIAQWLHADFPGKAIPLGISEWSADPGNPSWAYDDSFMSQFEQTALAGFEQNPYLSFATQFDIASYAGYGTLDLFRTSYPEATSGSTTLDYSETPLAIGSARPSFGVLAGQIAALSSGSTSTPTPAPTSTPPAPTATPAPPSPSPTPTSSGVPRYAHVITILLENHDYSQVVGSSSAPYINHTLIPGGALATNYDSVVDSSLPNYMILTGGTSLGWTDNCEPTPTPANGVGPCPGGLSTGTSIMSEATAAGLTWKSYEENMGSACLNAVDGGVGGLYTVHHNPAMFYTQLAASCSADDVDYSQLVSDLQSPSTLPAYVFVTPDLNDDMHNGAIQQGDTWLSTAIPAIQSSPACQQSTCLIAVTFDETAHDLSGAGAEQVMTVLSGPGITPGTQDNTAYDHYSLLRTEELALGLPTMTANDAGAPLMLGMFSSGGSGSPTPTPVPPSPTPTPTQPPSPTPTPTQPPSGSTLFSDNFAADAVGAPPAGWTLQSGNWDVEPDAATSAHVLLQTTSPEASSYIAVGSSSWTDYILTAQIKAAGGAGLNGTYNLMGRYTDANNHYSLILKNGDEWWLGVKQGGGWNTLAAGTFSYNATTWYTLALTFSGSKISASINGKLLATATDTTFKSGSIAWETNAAGELENVSVVAPGGSPPTPTPTPVPPTPAPVPPTPTPIPTPQPININNVSCTVMINGVSEKGTCSGSFTPS